MVLTKNDPKIEYPSEVVVLPGLETSMYYLESLPNIDTVWIIGGTQLYEEALLSSRCHRIYLTLVEGYYDSDTFFPDIPDDFKLQTDNANDELMPLGVFTDNGINYKYMIYERNKEE